jgi:hypothetical protein
MKNNKDFTKLFDLNIPVRDHFDYYIDQLSKTEKYKNIQELVSLFEEADKDIDNFLEYKVKKTNEIIDFIKSTNAYVEFCYDNNLLDLPTNNSYKYNDDCKYLSIDIRSANWTSIKKYDQLNELGDSYVDLLNKFNLPKIFLHSKYLRQFIFGNINAKKQQKIQRNIIQEVVRMLDDNYNIECVKNDEVIIKFNSFDDIKDVYNIIDQSKFRIKLFSVERIEDFRIDSIYDINGNVLYKEMVSVNGQLFYLKLKQYITKEKLDIRDLYFRNDGKLGIWVVDGLKYSI